MQCKTEDIIETQENVSSAGWHRHVTLSSSGVSHVQEEKRIQDSLLKDGYPAVFITMHTLPQQGQQSEEQAVKVSVTIPYIHGLSQSICRVLSSLAIKVTFLPPTPLNPEARAGPS